MRLQRLSRAESDLTELAEWFRPDLDDFYRMIMGNAFGLPDVVKIVGLQALDLIRMDIVANSLSLPMWNVAKKPFSILSVDAMTAIVGATPLDQEIHPTIRRRSEKLWSRMWPEPLGQALPLDQRPERSRYLEKDLRDIARNLMLLTASRTADGREIREDLAAGCYDDLDVSTWAWTSGVATIELLTRRVLAVEGDDEVLRQLASSGIVFDGRPKPMTAAELVEFVRTL